MSGPRKTAIVTGASQGIGAGIVKAFVERGFNVVANSRKVTQSTEVAASNQVALVDGHIGQPATAAKIVETALSRFKSIDVLVNNAGIFFTKPFTDYTAEDFKSLVSTNLEGFLYVTQLAIKQMLAQKTGGSIVTITAALARNPIRGVTAAVPMITKGGLETITQHLAMEYAKDGIRVNAVAPGVVDTPLHKETPKDVMQSLSPMGRLSTVKDITDAVMYLTDAATVTGDTINVDGGAISGAGNWLISFDWTARTRNARLDLSTITVKDGRVWHNRSSRFLGAALFANGIPHAYRRANGHSHDEGRALNGDARAYSTKSTSVGMQARRTGRPSSALGPIARVWNHRRSMPVDDIVRRFQGSVDPSAPCGHRSAGQAAAASNSNGSQ